MAKRESVPPMRPRDLMFSSTTSPASDPSAPATVKTSTYLRPEQAELLDRLRSAHRAAGRRTVSAADLIRAALDVAERHGDEWEEVVADAAR